MDENNFEKFPSGGESDQVVPVGQDFEKAMDSGVPEFAGDEFGFNSDADVSDVEVAVGESEESAEYDAGISDAAALINYGLNAATREMGVELVVQKIKSFDPSGSNDPIGDFFRYLGLDSPEERKEVRSESVAAKPSEIEFRNDVNAPSEKRSVEGAFAAIKDMKELISEVEGADPRYEELRMGAKAAGKGYFEYAVSNYGTRGLTELFTVLGQQREKKDEGENSAVEEIENAEGEDGAEPNTGENKDDSVILNPEILKK